MDYTQIPIFGDKDYKADIRGDCLIPLISQHNKHSEDLSKLKPLVESGAIIETLAGNLEALEILANQVDNITGVSSKKPELENLANKTGTILGLDSRVTALESSKGVFTGFDVERGGDLEIQDTLDNHNNRITTLEISQVEQDGRILSLEVVDESFETRILALENNSGGGGGGEVVDLKPITDRLDVLEVTDTDHNARITALEEYEPPVVTPPENKEPTKFYVLPMGGQSNCVGYGETSYDIKGFDAPNPRIKQLGRYSTVVGSISDLTTSEVMCNYGDKFNELRPHSDCNLKVIPATPCLDFSQNMFQHNSTYKGGTVGSGMYVARQLLKYIPEDYGILIVPCAYGGTGFTSGAVGTWNQAKLRGENAKKHGADLPLTKDFYYRTKYALELNEENVLLPFIWIQGENDIADINGHYNGFKTMFEWMRSKFEEDNLKRFLPEKRMDNYRWLCLGPTKWMMGATTQTDYVSHTNLDWERDSASYLKRVGIYNNYVFLSGEYKTGTGSQLYYVRQDVDSDGKFVETNNENGTGDTTSNKTIHLSTKGYSHYQAKNIVNSILRYSCLFSEEGVMFTRPILGGLGVTQTDNVVNRQFVGSNFNGINDGLLVHIDVASGGLTTNLAGTGKSVSAGSLVTTVSDNKLGNVAVLPGSSANSHLSNTLNEGSTSNTKIITFKPDNDMRTRNVGFLMSHSGSNPKGGLITLYHNSIIGWPDYTSGSRSCSLIGCGAIENNWNGKFNDWQTVALVYSKEGNQAAFYLNGNLVQSSTATGTPELNSLRIGNSSNPSTTNTFKGQVSSYRVYNRALGHDEIKAISQVDLFSKL